MFETRKRVSMKGGSVVSAVRQSPRDARTIAAKARSGVTSDPMSLAMLLPTWEETAASYTETAAPVPSMGSGMNMGMYGNLNISAISTYFQRSETLLRGIADEQEVAFRTFYRDIYRYDVVAGTAVDLMSVLPFSDFTLQGASPEQLDVFNRNLDNMGIRSLFPKISVDYFVSGRSISSMLFNNDLKSFTDLISHNPDNADVRPSPLFMTEPKITIRIDAELKNFLNSKDYYFQKLKQRIPPQVLAAMRNNNHAVLDPLTTLFLPRQLTPRSTGTSIYRRLIPIYLLEKVLYRGTITEAARRQRAIGHIMVGSQYWEPQDADLQAILSLFQQADLDPNGALVATRNDVQYQDVRQAGDFWKWTDVSEQLTPMKMRAMGCSEALLSGDANWNTQDAALSLFLEGLRAYREQATRSMLYDRIFPIVSIVNGFKPDKRYMETGNANIDSLDDETEDQLLFHQRGSTDLVIPSVRWNKQLKPEADREHLDVLNTLAERGVPIGLRTWSAAGGINLDEQMNEVKNDVKIRKKIAKLTGIDYADQSFQGSDTEQELSHMLKDMSDKEVRSAVEIMLGRDRKPLLGRDFGAAQEVIGSTRTGKPKVVHNQTKAHREANERFAASLKRISDPARFKESLNHAKQSGMIPPTER